MRPAPAAPPSGGSGAGSQSLQLPAGGAASSGSAIRAPRQAPHPPAASSLSGTGPPRLARPLPTGRSSRPSLTRCGSSSAASSGSGVSSLPWGMGLASSKLPGQTSLLPTPPPGNTPKLPSRAAERRWPPAAADQRTRGQPRLPLLASNELTSSSGSRAGLTRGAAQQHAVAAGGALTRSMSGMAGGLAPVAEARA